jgi:RHS repeat-associated protein
MGRVVIVTMRLISFGKVVAQSNAGVEFRYGYTGREQDAETGLDYYRARYYDASNGRFISEDLLGFSAGDANLTRYVGNNVVNWVDPSGQHEVKPLEAMYGLGEAMNKLIKRLELNPPPVRRETTPKKTTSPEPKIAPKYPDPNCPDTKKEKEDCAKEHPLYTTLSKAIGSGVPFEGYKNKTLPEAVGSLVGFRSRSTYIIKYKASPLVAQEGDFVNQMKEGELPKYQDPDKTARHFNIFIEGVSPNKSAGSIFKFRFCTTYDDKLHRVIKPKLVYRYGIDNIKDDGGNKHYN